MLASVARRIGQGVIVLLVVTLVTFVALHVIPGDAASLALGTDATPERLAALRASMGTDKPLPEQYVAWIGGVLTGNWGTSSLYGTDVWGVIAPTLPLTVTLAVYATLLALVVALVLGVASALRPGSVLDAFGRTVMQLAGAVPGFWLAILLMLAFGARLGWFPISGYVPLTQDFWGCLRSLTLPAAALAAGECGMLLRIVRSSVMDSLTRDYMLAPRVKGLSRVRTVFAYALRGTWTAPLTVAGLQLAKLLGGTVVVESVFALPGLGRLLLTAVEQRDVMLLQGIVLFVTAAVVVVSLVVDVLVTLADGPARRGAAAYEGGRP